MRLRLMLAGAAVACTLLPIPTGAAPRQCYFFSGTADAIVKSNAIEGSIASLQGAINKWKVANGVTGPVTQTAQRPRPHPYWRSSVSPDLFLPPDVITDSTHTVCWKGVVSPVVCTSGSKVCW